MEDGVGQARVVSADAFLLREDDDGDVSIYVEHREHICSACIC